MENMYSVSLLFSVPVIELLHYLAPSLQFVTHYGKTFYAYPDVSDMRRISSGKSA